ncbi:hypothetical protein C8R44DRAFT_92062 [Mycena epipterygia]|nr:hypothetical protein C8R44DRAFT_92062 [Mycena epipterygia]
MVFGTARKSTCSWPEAYATLANCLAKGNITRLSTRIRTWATCHRLCSGSDKLNLILAPGDSVFQVMPEEEQRMIKECRSSLDSQPQFMPSPSQKPDKDNVSG